MLTEGCDGVGGAQLPAPSPVTPDPVPSPVTRSAQCPLPSTPSLSTPQRVAPTKPKPHAPKIPPWPRHLPLRKKKNTQKPLKIAPYEGGGALRSGRPRAHTVNARPRPSRRRLAPRGGPAAISPSPPGWERAEGDEAQPLRAVFPGGARHRPPAAAPSHGELVPGSLDFVPRLGRIRPAGAEPGEGEGMGWGAAPPNTGDRGDGGVGSRKAAGGKPRVRPGCRAEQDPAARRLSPPPRQSPPPGDSASCQLPK